MRGDELAGKAFQPINSLSLPLRQRFKRSGPVLMIKTNIWGRPRHYWFYPSRPEKPRWEGVLIARFALCDEIKRAERAWNPIPKSKPQAVFHSWQQLLFTQRQTQVESSEEKTAPFSSPAFSFPFQWTGHKTNAAHCSRTHTAGHHRWKHSQLCIVEVIFLNCGGISKEWRREGDMSFSDARL